jgi:hypothetical protein
MRAQVRQTQLSAGSSDLRYKRDELVFVDGPPSEQPFELALRLDERRA